jgi:exodeoxyribonuclease VII large subunit
VLHVIERRQPSLELVLAPCRVQGAGAAEEIAGAIALLNTWAVADQARSLDLLLVTRGGGSLEDLWAFNEEVVARAVFNSTIPVVSAVGHEIDFTISDFVADLRAATPSAAAEIITEGACASRKFLEETAPYLGQLIRGRLEREQDALRHAVQRLVRLHPRSLLNERLQYLDDLQGSLLRCARQETRRQEVAWENLRQRLARVKPSVAVSQRHQALEAFEKRLREQAGHQLRNRRNQFTNLHARLHLLSPESVLARGYSITTDAGTGRIVRAAGEVVAGDRLKTRVQSGEISSTVID